MDWLGPNNLEATENQLRQDGWRVFRLAENIADREGFFASVRKTLPLDPPIISDWCWDALSDSLWEGLLELTDKRIAIVWPGASSLNSQDPEVFWHASSILSSVSASLADGRDSLGIVKDVLILLGQ
jgi:hypothetical protein